MVAEAAAALISSVDRPHRAIVHKPAPSLFEFETKGSSASEHSALSLRSLMHHANCIAGSKVF